jgi:hypothetical protein
MVVQSDGFVFGVFGWLMRLALPESAQAQKSGVTTNEPPFVVSITSNAVIVLDRTPVLFENLKARLQAPFGIDFDRAGNLYFVEMKGHRLGCIDAKGMLTTAAGTAKPAT